MAKVKNTTCTARDCRDLARVSGYCRRHYRRVQGNGSPYRPCKTCGQEINRQGVPNYCSPECKPPCTVPECGRKVLASGLCTTHYKHHQAGKELGVIPEYGREGCMVDGCKAKHVSKGYCSTHYGRLQKSGVVERDCPTCGASMDGRKTYCSELCFPRCSANGCDKTATYSEFGVCKNHSAGMYRYGRLPEYTWATEKKCVVCGKEHEHPRFRKVCSEACQQLLHRNGGEAPPMLKQCTRCTTIIDLSVRHPSGRKRRADIKVCDACHKAKYTRHRMSVTELADRDGTDCKICREPVDMSLVFPDMFRGSVDHILPYASGGSHDPENLQLSHLWCNLVKQNRPGFVM